MIETIIYEYLKAKLDIPVYLEKPADPPKAYVYIERVAGGSANHINSASFAFQSYGKTLFEAAKNNEDLKLKLVGNGDDVLGIVNETNIYSCKLQTDYKYTDTYKKQYRYQAVFDFNY